MVGAHFLRDVDFLREHIDFTNISPYATEKEIVNFCHKAADYRVKTVYVPPIFLHTASRDFRACFEIGTTAGFPYGNVPFAVKEKGIDYAWKNGAKWIDVVADISLIKSNNWFAVEKEIQALVECVERKMNLSLKLIIETPYLSDEEIKYVVEIADSNDVYCIKTATGVGNKVKLKHVELIKPLLKRSKLKVAGGITTLEDTLTFFNRGADIIGSSKGFEILEEFISIHPD